MYGHKFTFYLKFDGVFYLTGLRENIGIIEKKICGSSNRQKFKCSGEKKNQISVENFITGH